MLALALAALGTAAVAALVLRRRRSHRAGLAASFEPLPPGLTHLASTVSDLSDFGLHLPGIRRSALARRPRLGALLGLRQS